MITTLFFLQSSIASPGVINLVFIGGMVLVFWFMIYRPQAKKTKDQKVFTEEMKAGDKVVTASGIIGTVVRLEDQIITLDVGVGSNKNNIKVTRNAVSKELTDAIFRE
jgi:preprotein translocase subunit YajC